MIESRASALRGLLLLVHRYVGLFLSFFLLVAGLTGTLLAFREPLDRALNPELFSPPLPANGPQLLEPFDLARRVTAQLPAQGGSLGYTVDFDLKPGHAVSIWVEAEPEEWREYFVNPASGAVLGSRAWGDISEGKKNLIPFIYRLHYSLALDEVGSYLFGVVALLWVADCLVGAWLTLPSARRRERSRKSPGIWLRRWLPAWLIKAKNLFALVFTWHRASGLWVWGMLLVFAWSGVALNLSEVYRPILEHSIGFEDSIHEKLPELPPPHKSAGLGPELAYARATELMNRELGKLGATVKREMYFSYAPEHGAFMYGVESSLDISTKSPNTVLYLDGQSAELLGLDVPTGRNLGATVTSWLYALHFGSVGGLWYEIFVSGMGLSVALLSVTGVWIWLRKRRLPKNRRAEKDSAPSPLQLPEEVSDLLTN